MSSETDRSTSVSRRSVAKGIAWASPVIMTGAASPAVAASDPLVVVLQPGVGGNYTLCGDYCQLNPERCPDFVGTGAILTVLESPYVGVRGFSFTYTAVATVDSGVITRVWSGHLGGNCAGEFPGATLNAPSATFQGIAQDTANHIYSYYYVIETQGASSITVTVTASGRGSVTETLVLTP